MKNEPKTDVLLHMMEQPERYTEEQWRDILSDSECRELYTLMAMTHGSLNAAKADAAMTEEEIEEEWERVKGMTNDESRFARNDESKSPSNPEGNSYSSFITRHSSFITRHSSFITRHSSFKKIAAIFLAAVFLGGLAWAISPFLRHMGKTPQSAKVTAPSLTRRAGGESGGGSLLLFADVRLDSMLAIVSQHYGKAVFFGDEELKALRIHTKWNREDSLAAFIENLNELDELSLTEQRDTIFVQKGGAQ